MAMTLESVRDWFRTEHKRSERAWWYTGEYKAMADAVTAHLTQPAQAVDVPPIKPVLPDAMLIDRWRAIGWNECRNAMLDALPASPTPDKETQR